jgi:flagellar hook-associated protein 2
MLFALGPAASAGASGAAPLPLPPLADSTDTATITLDLEGLLPEISALGIRNRDTGRRLELVSARIFDPAETGGLRPKKPISSAGDALVSVDGVEGSRESNEIKDMVPGVTLQLKEAADKPVKLSIEPDRKSAKEAIIALVGNYNKLMAWVNILTRADPAVIAQLDYFTDAEKKTAGERLGIYQGDSTLSVLKNNLQRAMMEPYATRMGRDLSLLSQIGVSTDARKGGGQGLDTSRLLGYIEIDEESLDKALAANFSAVRDLFGNDTTGDLVVDSGVAYTLDMGLKPYVETGGILALKSQTITTQIGTQKRTLATLDEALAAKESDLKRKYGMMEGALNSMQSSGNSIDNSIRNSGG